MRILDNKRLPFYACTMFCKLSRVCAVLVGVAVLCSVCASCAKKAKTAELFSREERFTLNYGSFEDELDLFDFTGTNDTDTHIQMQDGFFYIVNGGAQKIMQFTSFGDLLGVYYNADTNPVPSFVSKSDSFTANRTTQRAVPYQFNAPHKIAVDSAKRMYVVDKLPTDRQEYDAENNLLLRDVVLCFDEHGAFVDFLGQRGPGGLPFPYVSGVYTAQNNELVVVSFTNEGYLVNWFNDEGFLLFTIPLEHNAVPLPFEEEGEVFVSISAIIPDYTERVLYLSVDYYQSEIDVTSGVQAGITYVGTYVYPLNAETGLFGSPLLIPGYEEETEGENEKSVYTKPFQFLGVTESGWFFFITPIENGYVVQIMQTNGQKILRKQLFVSDEETVYNTMSLSKEGIITALLAGNVEASVVWWRTDEVIDALIK